MEYVKPNEIDEVTTKVSVKKLYSPVPTQSQVPLVFQIYLNPTSVPSLRGKKKAGLFTIHLVY